MDAISSAQQGLLSAAQGFDRASTDLQASFTGASPSASTGAIVDQLSAKTAFVASTGVLKTAQDMFKALLDITV